MIRVYYTRQSAFEGSNQAGNTIFIRVRVNIKRKQKSSLWLLAVIRKRRNVAP